MKIVSGDSSWLKSVNKSSILQMIRQHAPLSRADIAKKLTLTRATVSTLVQELIDDHLVIEIGTGVSSGGRKPVLLEMNREAGFVFGIDLRSTEIILVIANMYGEMIDNIMFRYENEHDEQHTLQQVIDIIKHEREKLASTPLGLLGVGIGVHGFVEYPSHRILFLPHVNWTGADWRETIEQQCQVNVVIDNEANLAAIAELEVGGDRYSQLIYLSIGAGIGAGTIVDGNIVRGHRGYAGEVGHTTIALDGRQCSCGNRGCWEMYGSEKVLAKALGLAYRPGVSNTITAMLEQEHPRALQAISETGMYLGIGIGNMIHTFDPQLVIIGNRMGKYETWLHPHIQAAIQERFTHIQQEAVEIRYSELAEDACALGAAHLMLRHILQF